MAVAIVHRALVGIRQHRVGFADFLEFLFRVRIVRIAVGMILERQLAVGTLQFNLRAGALNPKHLVVIAFCVCGQKWLSLII
jgi:hypothetical protein